MAAPEIRHPGRTKSTDHGDPVDVWEITKILVRRWTVVVPILVLGLVLALVTSSGIQPEYKASGVLLVLPPTESGASEIGGVVIRNPYTTLGPRVVAQAIVIQMNSDEMRLDLAAQGFKATYVFVASQRNPLISIDVSGTDQSQVATTLGALITRAEDEMIRRQEPFVDKAVPVRLTIEELSRSAIPSEDFTGRSRLRIAIVAVSVLLAAASAVFVDGFGGRIRDRLRNDDSETREPELASAESTDGSDQNHSSSVRSAGEPIGSGRSGRA